jgi:methyltransferase (TIGR00027 family)
MARQVSSGRRVTGQAPGQVRRSATAEIVCAQRAAETLRPPARRLIDDPYARHFLTKGTYRFLTASRLTAAVARRGFDRLYPGYMAIVLLRNRWYEAVLADALAAGVEQVVLLGAGYDTTSLRLSLDGRALFEVDAAPTQQAKREVIRRRGLARGAVRYVPCDFERDTLPERLRESGFDPGARSLVAWWGVSFFLGEDAARNTVADVASLTAPGSLFLFDYLDPEVVDGTTAFRGARRARAAVARRGEPYRFGLGRDQAGQLLGSSGFDVEDNLSITELARLLAPAPGFPYRTDDFFGVITARRAAR